MEIFSSSCRMCASITDSDVSLLDTSQHNLQWAVNNLKVKFEDGLPTGICLLCIKSIMQWTAFVNRSKQANSLFKKIIENQDADNQKSQYEDTHPELISSCASVSSEESTTANSSNKISADINLAMTTPEDEYEPNVTPSKTPQSVLDKQLQVNLTQIDTASSTSTSRPSNECNLTLTPNIPVKSTPIDLFTKYNIKKLSIKIEKLSEEEIKTPIKKQLPRYSLRVVRNKEANLAKNSHLRSIRNKYNQCSMLHGYYTRVKFESDNVCPLCDFKSLYTSYLKRHILFYHKGIGFTCKQCSKSYMFRYLLKNHMNLVHNIDMEKDSFQDR